MASQESLQSLFDQAQQKLAAKDFPSARDLLLKIKEQGFTSASLEAALARAQFEAGEHGLAVQAWSQAIALDRLNTTYRSDLELAQSKIPGGVGTKLEHPAEFAQTLSSYARPSEQFLGASVLLLILLWLKLSGMAEKTSKALRIFLLSLSFIFAASAGFSLWSQSISVLMAPTTLKPAPLESAEGSLELAPGTRVRVLKKSGAFVEIERPNSFRGWVKEESISRSIY
jgi:hypothetical protein